MATRQEIADTIERYKTSPRVGRREQQSFAQDIRDYTLGMKLGFAAAATSALTALALHGVISARIGDIEESLDQAPARIHNLGERFYVLAAPRSEQHRQSAIAQAAMTLVAREKIDHGRRYAQIGGSGNEVTLYSRDGKAPVAVHLDPGALAEEYRKALTVQKDMADGERQQSLDYSLIIGGCFLIAGLRQRIRRDTRINDALNWFGVK